MTSTTRPARVAVVGAGPGGLTLARVLQRHGVDVVVHDRDRGPDDRPQGGTLDLHGDTGQVALQAAGLLEEFLARSRPEGQDGRIRDHTGAVLFEQLTPDGETFKPEIDRGDLRALLLESLAPGTVRWDSAVRAVTPADGGWRLELADGRTSPCDLVVGADGAWSRVRPLLSTAVPEYSGVTFVEIVIKDVDAAHPDLAALVGRGSMSAFWRNQGLFAQRNSRGIVRVYVAFRRPLHWLRDQGIDEADPAVMRSTLLGMFAEWGAPMRAFLEACDDSFVVRPIMALPVPHRWAHRSGVTLLGDAAHLMSPFGGQGANLAMLDGADLGLALAAEGALDAAGLDRALRRYEEGMFPRAEEAATFAARGIARSIAPDAPAHSLAVMEALAAGKDPAQVNA